MADIIITNLSILKNDTQKRDYFSDLGPIEGINTNDAPVKYLIRSITGSGKTVDRIIAVTTEGAETAFISFCNMLSDYSAKTGIQIPVPEKIPAIEDNFAETIRQVTERFSPCDRAYIDTTGGFRNSSYFLMCVVRILGYSGIVLKKAVYSRLGNSPGEDSRIIDITELYDMYDLINAVDAFTNYGNSHGLEEYFRNTAEPEIKETVSAMNSFSEMISLCRTSGLTDILGKLDASLEKLNRTDTDSAGTMLFKSLIPTIKDRFHITEKGIEYPDIVRWCLRNRLIQQAVTIYVEKMPEYFYKVRLFTISDGKLGKVKAEKANSHFDLYYEMFYHSFMVPDKDIPVMKLLSAASEGYPKGCIFNNKNRLHLLFGKLLNSKATNKIIDLAPAELKDRSELAAALESFIRLRDSLYDCREKRKEASDIDLSAFPADIAELITKKGGILPKTTEGFIRSTANDEALCLLLSGRKPARSGNTRIAFIESLSDGLISKDFAISTEPDRIQRILRDIIYAKTFIRNKLNHASDDDSADKEMQEYFSSYGYNVSSELKADDIIEFMENAVNFL